MSTERKTTDRNFLFPTLWLVLASWILGGGVALADPPESEEGEIEIEMDGLWGGGDEQSVQAPSPMVRSLCRRLSRDDHGDFWPCATRLTPGLELVAALGDSNGMDRDLFTFQLGVPGDGRKHSVGLALAAQTEVELRLRSAGGFLLEPETRPLVPGSDSVARFRGLLSGTYYLEATGRDGGAGLYALRLDTRSE